MMFSSWAWMAEVESWRRVARERPPAQSNSLPPLVLQSQKGQSALARARRPHAHLEHVLELVEQDANEAILAKLGLVARAALNQDHQLLEQVVDLADAVAIWRPGWERGHRQGRRGYAHGCGRTARDLVP